MKEARSYRRQKRKARTNANANSTFSESTNDKLFSVKTFEGLAADMKSGRIPKDKMSITDGGLQVIMRNTGTISYHALYTIGGSRPSLAIGHHPDMTIAEARRLVGIIQGLADMGIDPQAGLHERLMVQLKEKGLKWRP